MTFGHRAHLSESHLLVLQEPQKHNTVVSMKRSVPQYCGRYTVLIAEKLNNTRARTPAGGTPTNSLYRYRRIPKVTGPQNNCSLKVPSFLGKGKGKIFI